MELYGSIYDNLNFTRANDDARCVTRAQNTMGFRRDRYLRLVFRTVVRVYNFIENPPPLPCPFPTRDAAPCTQNRERGTLLPRKMFARRTLKRVHRCHRRFREQLRASNPSPTCARSSMLENDKAFLGHDESSANDRSYFYISRRIRARVSPMDR